MNAKTTTKHPYAAIEHRVIDSPAYAALTFSARSLLTLLTRQLSKDNNGHLQATFSYMGKFGFSENTLSRGIQELQVHGFVYRSKTGGFHRGAAQFAVTWLTVKNPEGLYMRGFKPCAWRDWQPVEKKTRPPKLHTHNCKNGELTTPTPPKIAANKPPKLGDIVFVPIEGSFTTTKNQHEAGETRVQEPARSEYTRTTIDETTEEWQEPDDAIKSCGTMAEFWDGDLGEFVKPAKRHDQVLAS